MTFQSAPECASVAVQFTRAGKNLFNVLNFWLPGGYLQADLDDLADVCDGVVAADYLPYVAADITYDQVSVRGLESVIDLSSVNNDNTGTGGAVSGAGIPSNASLCLTLRTGFTGRSARGRFFAVPTTTDNLLTTQQYTTAYGAAIEDFLENLVAQTLSEGWHLVILSRISGGAPRATAIHNDVTQVVVRNTLVDSMNSRLAAGH